MCMCCEPAWIYVYHMHISRAPDTSESLELKLVVFMGYCVHTGNVLGNRIALSTCNQSSLQPLILLFKLPGLVLNLGYHCLFHKNWVCPTRHTEVLKCLNIYLVWICVWSLARVWLSDKVLETFLPPCQFQRLNSVCQVWQLIVPLLGEPSCWSSNLEFKIFCSR